MKVIVAAAAANANPGFGNSKDFDPTPAMTLWASKWKGSLPQAKADMKVTENKPTVASKKTCICAPTSHAGSFRCQLHRTTGSNTAENSEDYDRDKEISDNLDSMKMILHRKFSHEKPQLSRFGRAAAATVNNVYGNYN